ncbi:MAG: LysE family translocator [Rhodospirillaceae bacterium]
MDPTLWTSLIAVLAVWTVTVITPGPNFLVTAHHALQGGWRSGLAAALGVAFGTAIWALASLGGLGVLFHSAAWLYQAVKIAGGLYLIWVGYRMWRVKPSQTLAPPADSAEEMPSIPLRRAFVKGLIIDLSNPKAAVFFTSLFAVAVPPSSPMLFQAGLIAAVVAIAALWYGLVACVVDWPPVAARLQRAQHRIEKWTGALFMALGLKVVLSRD